MSSIISPATLRLHFGVPNSKDHKTMEKFVTSVVIGSGFEMKSFKDFESFNKVANPNWSLLYKQYLVDQKTPWFDDESNYKLKY